LPIRETDQCQNVVNVPVLLSHNTRHQMFGAIVHAARAYRSHQLCSKHTRHITSDTRHVNTHYHPLGRSWAVGSEGYKQQLQMRI